jgi:hypothetical protein
VDPKPGLKEIQRRAVPGAPRLIALASF